MNLQGISREQIQSLAKRKEGLSVSMFLPTAENRLSSQDRIRLKNMVLTAEAELTKVGMRSTSARELLATAEELTDNEAFWSATTGGVAIFVGEDFFESYHLSFPVPEMVQVGRRFNILPLIPAFGRSEPHYALALDRKSVRLLLCTQDATTEVHVPTMPKSLASFLCKELAEEGGMRPSFGLSGSTGIMLQEGSVDREAELKQQIHRYCKAVNEVIGAYLEGSKGLLVLTGSEEMVESYKKVCTYPNRLPTHAIQGIRALKPVEIREMTQPIADEVAEHRRYGELNRYLSVRSSTTLRHSERRRKLA